MRHAKVTLRAKLDWDRAYVWYSNLGGNLADRLDAAITLAIDTARDHPHRFPEVMPGVHRVLVDDFPYKLMYRLLNESTIEVLAIYHGARNPDKWNDAERD